METIIINKTGESVAVGFDGLPEVSKAFVINYGLRRILNDYHSSVQAKDYPELADFHKAVMEAVRGKLAALESGQLTTRRASAEPVDPIGKIAYRMAKETVAKALRTKGLTVAKIGKEKAEELAQNYLDKNLETLTKLAKAEFKRVNDAAIEVDLSDLGL